MNNSQIDKLGNAIIKLSEGVNDMSKTKILKLIYLLEEESIKRFGHPFFGLDYQVWQYGPVSQQLFVELSDDLPNFLNKYIDQYPANYGDVLLFKPKTNFNDDEFSNIEINLLNAVKEMYGHLTANELISLTHEKDSLWYKKAAEHGLLEKFEKKIENSSTVTIDFSKLIENDIHLSSVYNEYIDNNKFFQNLS